MSRGGAWSAARPLSGVVLERPNAPLGVPAAHQQAPAAAACRSMPQRQILGAVGGGFEACRSMPQRAKICTSRTFFFITCQTCEPFVAQISQNWMVAQWSVYQVSDWRVLGSIPRKCNFLPVSSSLLLHRSSLFWCCFDMSSPADTQTTEASQTCAAFGK